MKEIVCPPLPNDPVEVAAILESLTEYYERHSSCWSTDESQGSTLQLERRTSSSLPRHRPGCQSTAMKHLDDFPHIDRFDLPEDVAQLADYLEELAKQYVQVRMSSAAREFMYMMEGYAQSANGLAATLYASELRSSARAIRTRVIKKTIASLS